jgi:hypothetical protein
MHVPFKMEQSFKYASVERQHAGDPADRRDRYGTGFDFARISKGEKTRSLQRQIEQHLACHQQI